MRTEARGETDAAAERETGSEAETEAFGRLLAASLETTDVVYLKGNLGSGKTAVARGVAEGRGAVPRQVASPTFALLHEYAGQNGEIVLRHLDLYRLADSPRELDVLGLPDSVRGAPVLVEWPNRAIAQMLPPTLEVSIERRGESARRIAWRRVGKN